MAENFKATTNGSLSQIDPNLCYIDIPGFGKIELNNLPDISDSKSANYNNEAIIGRSSPLTTYSHSSERTIGMQLHFFVVDPGDEIINLRYLRALQSAVYPRQGNGTVPFVPPPVCQIKCGELLASEPLCCILMSYSVKFPTEVAWSTQGSTFTPYRFDVETNWQVVYSSQQLPYQNRIVTSGR